MDGPSAVASRRWLLDLAAADRMLVQDDRFPFPAAGYVVRSDDRYDLLPMMWRRGAEEHRA